MTIRKPDELLMTPREVAEYLRINPQSLANMRAAGRSIPFHKFGRKVLYRFSDVEAALNAGRFGPQIATAKAKKVTAKNSTSKGERK